MKLEISLFRFDYKSDYLPYYTKHFLTMDKSENLLDVLNKINEKENFSYEKNKEFELVINGLFLNCSITCAELVKNFGNDLIIEPISIRRTHTDFLINEDDFNEKFNLFKEFTDQKDLEKYNSYKRYFYASNTLGFEKDYIGDAALLLADDLIQKDKENKTKILEIIKEYDIGAQYYTSLENRVYNLDPQITEKIQNIRELLKLTKKEPNIKINKIDFPELEKEYEIKHSFSDFKIAYYSQKPCENSLEILNKLDADILNLKSLRNDLAKNTFHINEKFSYKLSSKVLLEAFDNSADFVLVDNENDFNLLDGYQKNIEKGCGREINIPILHKSELQLLASGKHIEAKKLFENHKINPEII